MDEKQVTNQANTIPFPQQPVVPPAPVIGQPRGQVIQMPAPTPPEPQAVVPPAPIPAPEPQPQTTGTTTEPAPIPAIKEIVINQNTPPETPAEIEHNAELEAKANEATNNPPPEPAAPEAPKAPEATLLKMAKITVTTAEGDKDFECLRNLTQIKKFLDETLLPNKDAITKLVVQIGFTDGRYQTLIEGTYDVVNKFCDDNIIDGVTAMEMVKHLCIRLVETSDLKCAMFTLIFDGARVGGVGIHNDTMPIDPMEIKAFLNAVGGQLDMFANQMIKKYPLIGGSANKGRIILP